MNKVFLGKRRKQQIVFLGQPNKKIIDFIKRQKPILPPANKLEVKFFVDSVQYGETQYVDYGGKVARPKDPSKIGHTFSKWDKSDSDLDHVTSNLNVNAIFNINIYKANFKDWNNSVVETKYAQYGSVVTYPTHPSSRLDYDPNGWNPSQIASMPDHDVDVIAQYKLKEFQVTFINQANRAKFIEPEKYNKKYPIHSEVSYPEVECEPGYTWDCEPSEITDLTATTNVTLHSYGKGLLMLSIDLSGDVTDKRVRLNKNWHNINDEEYSLVDKGNGISSFAMYAEDLIGEKEILEDATSAFIELSDNLVYIHDINPTNLNAIDNIAHGCSSIVSVSLNELTAVETASKMFKDCLNLTYLSIVNNSFIEQIGDEETFANCNNLSSIRFYGKLLDYQSNETLVNSFGEATLLCVDVDHQETHSILEGGLYGSEDKRLITTADNIIQVYFDTSAKPGAKSGIANNIKYSEKGQKFGFVPTPELNGYQIEQGTNGWRYADGAVVTNINVLTSDITCYISMVPRLYFITYNTNGGKINQSIVNDYTIENSVVLPTDVTKDQYDFNGWFDNAELSGDPIVEIPVGSTGNVTVYAKWTLKKYSVSARVDTEYYVPEGAQIEENDPTGGHVEGIGEYNVNTSVTLTAIPNDGYEFKKWNDGSTSATRTITVTSDMSYVAVFNSLDQSLPEYFEVAIGEPTENDITVVRINEIGKGIIQHMDIPENFES